MHPGWLRRTLAILFIVGGFVAAWAVAGVFLEILSR
jgi:hypothetical protein